MMGYKKPIRRPEGLSKLEVLQWYKKNRMEKVKPPESCKGLGKCWIYTGYVTAQKEGNCGIGISWKGKMIRLNRLSLQMHMKLQGLKLDKTFVARQKCGKYACFNPKHLVAVKKIPPGQEHPNAKLTEDEVVRIRRIFKKGLGTHIELAKEFGVSRENIAAIITRRSWTHI